MNKAESGMGAKVLTEQAKGVSDSKDVKCADSIPERECMTLTELNLKKLSRWAGLGEMY